METVRKAKSYEEITSKLKVNPNHLQLHTGSDVGREQEKMGESDGDGERFLVSPNEQRDGDQTRVRKEDETASEERERNVGGGGETTCQENGRHDEDCMFG